MKEGVRGGRGKGGRRGRKEKTGRKMKAYLILAEEQDSYILRTPLNMYTARKQNKPQLGACVPTTLDKHLPSLLCVH